ncbi:thiamine phosphate synthase [Sphingomonas sp. LHG3406-1]|uniref:thiamine phosphate synthase n=1 Tax=Sphingomonas sp. LHG3406-1 TaxID=2804617 RepID=UPI00261C4CD0|nr:thiamine phosphate synthase [Sphingomonas sp. LHG3406-1]
MTDERMGDALDAAIARAAAAGAGVIVRHHESPAEERRRIAGLVRAHGALLGISRDLSLARETGAALIHNPDEPTEGLPFSLSVHDAREARLARNSLAALVFVSPVHATRSHPGEPCLGEDRARALAELAGKPAIALGGMDAERGERLMRLDWAGWAGIDCWLRT